MEQFIATLLYLYLLRESLKHILTTQCAGVNRYYGQGNRI